MAKPAVLAQQGGAFMWTTRSEHAPQGSYHYACNMIPLEPRNAESALIQRPAFTPFAVNGTVTGTILAMGRMVTLAGLNKNWILSSDGIWITSGGVYSKEVSAANLASASVTLGSGTHYWCIFNNTVCFNPSDGTNKPFTWNGASGAGGMVPLTNAPISFGRPTVYNAKLFLIKYALRDTISWSEEAAANTGYEMTGYSNVWKLGQTGTQPLFVLLGTNEALYYFRQTSIGAIRGAAGPDFVTSGTHDSISTSIGTQSPAGACEVDTDLWFVDQLGVPQVLQAGSTPQAVTQEMRAEATIAEPFGFDDVGWDRTTPAALQGIEVMAVPSTQSLPYRTVWFHVKATTPTAARAFLVCHAESRHALAWFVPFVGVAIAPYAGLMADTDNPIGSIYPSILHGTDGTLFYAKGNGTADANRSNTGVSSTYRVIGAPLGGNAFAEYQFERLTVTTAVNTTGSAALGVQVLTSRRDSASLAGTAQTPTLPALNKPERLTIGLNQNGRWARPVFTAISTAIAGWTVSGWALLGFPVATGPTVP